MHPWSQNQLNTIWNMDEYRARTAVLKSPASPSFQPHHEEIAAVVVSEALPTPQGPLAPVPLPLIPDNAAEVIAALRFTHDTTTAQQHGAELAALVEENRKLNAKFHMVQRMNETYQEQYHQQRDNTMLLIRTLRKANPAAFEAIKGQLHGNINELDKLTADATRYREQYEELNKSYGGLKKDVESLRVALAGNQQRLDGAQEKNKTLTAQVVEAEKRASMYDREHKQRLIAEESYRRLSSKLPHDQQDKSVMVSVKV